MAWTSWATLGVFIAGFILFLYGANYYNAIAGWGGVFLCVGAVAFIVLKQIYGWLTKKPNMENQ